MAKKTRRQKQPKQVRPQDVYPFVFETFRRFGQHGYDVTQWKTEEPSSWNETVSFRKYRITIEQVEESNDVLYERLLKLWRECNNMHHWGPLKAAAESIGRTLPSELLGKNAPPRR